MNFITKPQVLAYSGLIVRIVLIIFQVLSAKVVAKAHSKVRFGYVTVATPEQAQTCIKELNGSELKGNTINVEMVRERGEGRVGGRNGEKRK